VILDFLLAPANVTDLEAGAELLAKHRALLVLGDTGYLSAPVAADLLATTGITLLTVPRKNQRRQLPAALAALQTRWRQIVETVNGQLAALLHIEDNHAHSFDGLCARLYSKLTAHTMAVYLNRLLGNPACIHLKALAFPN
jgi:hypothetical protein